MAERIHIGGVTNTRLHLENDGTMHVEEIQDVEPILDFAHAARNARFSADACDGMLRHEAEVPFVIFQKECEKRGIVVSLGSLEANEVIEAILRNPEYSRFLTAPKTRDAHVIMRGSR